MQYTSTKRIISPTPRTAVFEMKLILMRHAQAEWGFGIEDHDRALSAKGQVEAHSLGLWLTANDHQPSLALISDAKRTQQTFMALNQACKTAVLTELYLAESKSLLLAIQNIETNCLLVLAHNPGIGEFAVDVINTKPTHKTISCQRMKTESAFLRATSISSTFIAICSEPRSHGRGL